MAHNTAQSSDNDEEVSAITEPREPTLTTIIPITRCQDPEDNPVPFTRQTEEKPAPAPAPQKASPPPGWPRSGPVPPRTPAGGLQRSGSLRRNNNTSSTGSSSLARSGSLRVKRPEAGEAKARVPQSPATARRTAAAASNSSAKLQRTPSLRRKTETGNNNNNNSGREADKEDKPFVRKLHTRESLRRRAREAADKASVEREDSAREEASSASTARPAGPVNTEPSNTKTNK